MADDFPVPVLRGEERLFYEHARHHRLVYQRCLDCGARYAYPRALCVSCLGEEVETTAAAGTGTIHTFTTQHRPGHPAFKDAVPYTVGLVDLDEGPRVLSSLHADDEADIAIGARVRVEFEDITEEFTVPRFRVLHDSEER